MPAPTIKKDQKVHGDQLKGSIWSRLTEERGREFKVRSVSDVGPG